MRALARFPEESPDPVLRVGANGAVLFANAAARAVDGLIIDGRTLAPALAAAVSNSIGSHVIGQASLVAGGRRFEFSLTPMAVEDCVIINGKELTAERADETEASALARFAAENPSPMLRVDNSGSVLFATAAARALDGLTLEGGRRLVPQLATKVAEAFASRKVVQVEFSNGLRLYVFAVTPVPGEAYLNLYGRDVSDEWRAQREIKSLAKFPEENPYPVLRVDGLGGVLFANAAAKQAPGLLAEDGRRLCGALATCAENAFATKRTVEAEFAAGPRLLAYSFMPVAHESYINVVARDMTAERRASHDAQRGKQFHETILAKLNCGVLTLDAQLRVTSANPAALRLFGLDLNEMRGHSLAEIVTEDRWLLDALAADANGSEPRVFADRLLTTAKGARRSATVTVFPLADDTGARGHMLVTEEVDRESRLRASMARSVADPVIGRLLSRDDALLDGVAQPATIVAATIRNGAALATSLDAKSVVSLFNEHLAAMCEVILGQGGTLDTVGADGLRAAFGVPFADAGDAERAVKAASAMLTRSSALATKGRPSLEIGVGIDTGTIVAGKMGPDRRRDYAIAGAPASLAGRLPGIAAQYGAGILITGATRAALPGNGRLRELDLVRIAGVAEPVKLFEVLDHLAEDKLPDLEAMLVAFQEGLALYRARDFEDAAKAFGEALRLNPQDRPSRLYVTRCWTLQAHPPAADWQGVNEIAGL